MPTNTQSVLQYRSTAQGDDKLIRMQVSVRSAAAPECKGLSSARVKLYQIPCRSTAAVAVYNTAVHTSCATQEQSQKRGTAEHSGRHNTQITQYDSTG